MASVDMTLEQSNEAVFSRHGEDKYLPIGLKTRPL